MEVGWLGRRFENVCVVAEGRVPVASRASTHDIQYLDSPSTKCKHWKQNLPAHDESVNLLVRTFGKPFSANVGKLGMGVDLDYIEIATTNMVAKEMVRHADVFASRSQVRKAGEGKGTIVVFIYV